MKNLKFNLLVVLVLIFLGTGCDNFLNKQPQTFVSSSDYYNTPEDINNAVNGAYSQLQNLYAAGNSLWAAAEMRSDNTTFQYNPADRGDVERESMDDFTLNADYSPIEELWTNLYGGISDCNVVIDRIKEVDFEDAQVKNQYMGEAKFLRALNYFHLVRLYGGVPLFIHAVENPGQANKNRSGVDEIYQQIITDLQDAIDNLPESYSTQKGRATEGAARTLLADVYMTRSEFESAVEQLQKVTEMNYSLLPKYSDNFDPANKNNSESIFEIQYQSGISGGEEASNWIYRFAPFNSGSDIIGFNDLATYYAGYNIPTFDMVEAYEDGDERKTASIAFYEREGNSDYAVALGDSIPFINKYNHSFEQPGQTNENWPVYRYSEALLMLAESLNEIGRTGEAFQYLNKVRNRAGLNSFSGLSQSKFRDVVYHEERVESAFENDRWYDLLRTGRAVEIMSSHGQEMLERVPRLTDVAYNIQDYKLLFPIPSRVIRVNGLEQNPGW